MRPAPLAIAALVAILGLVWLGQGLGLIGGSFMSGSMVWAVIGAVLIVAAALIVVRERRTRRG